MTYQPFEDKVVKSATGCIKMWLKLVLIKVGAIIGAFLIMILVAIVIALGKSWGWW